MSDHKDLRLGGIKIVVSDDFKDDPIIKRVHERVQNMRKSPPNPKVPGSNVVGVLKPVVHNKKVKITQRIINDSYARLRVLVAGEEITAGSIAVLVAYAMQLSNEMLDTNKQHKIELALAILRKLIDDEVDDIAENATLHMLVETMVPSLVNTLSKLPNLFAKLCGCCGTLAMRE